jgi:diguanylate cyclase (GGDEF)-like protein
MGLSEALLSLAGLCIGDAFGASLNSLGNISTPGSVSAPFPSALIERRVLPHAPWRWTADTQLALSVVEELEQREWIDQDNLARRMAWRFSADPARGFGPGARLVLERIAQGEYFRSVRRAAYDGGSYGCLAASRGIPIGAFFSSDLDRAAREARLAAAITHLHPESQAGAEAVAVAAALAAGATPRQGADFLQDLASRLPDSLVSQAIQKAVSIPPGQPGLAAQMLGAGRRNTVFDTVPFALWCAAHHLDSFEEALWVAASAGGKRSTNCAIVGGILALASRGVPEEWKAHCEPLPRRIRIDQQVEPVGPGADGSPLAVENSYPAPGLSREPELASIRVDPLTGLPNLLGLLDWTKRQAEQPDMAPFSLLAIHFISLWDVNRTQGRTAGDDLLRAAGRTLQAWSPGQVFRAGGDKFIVILPGGLEGADAVREQAREIVQSISVYEGQDIRPPRAAVIHFRDPKYATPGYLLASLYVTLADRNFKGPESVPRTFDVEEIRAAEDFPWMMIDLADQMLRMSGTADESIRLAHTDSISQLPNMRAALNALDASVNRARRLHEPLAVLLIDGDNLRRYNQVSYEAGDEAIRLLGRTLKGQLRETDFIARWRTGDEFLILLPGGHRELALQVGQRLCRAVEQASRAWLFPSTISIGVALFPDQGRAVQNLLEAAEQGLEAAKQNGKNQVLVGRNH